MLLKISEGKGEERAARCRGGGSSRTNTSYRPVSSGAAGSAGGAEPRPLQQPHLLHVAHDLLLAELVRDMAVHDASLPS